MELDCLGAWGIAVEHQAGGGKAAAPLQLLCSVTGGGNATPKGTDLQQQREKGQGEGHKVGVGGGQLLEHERLEMRLW
jgi:hypothetical protein